MKITELPDGTKLVHGDDYQPEQTRSCTVAIDAAQLNTVFPPTVFPGTARGMMPTYDELALAVLEWHQATVESYDWDDGNRRWEKAGSVLHDLADRLPHTNPPKERP